MRTDEKQVKLVLHFDYWVFISHEANIEGDSIQTLITNAVNEKYLAKYLTYCLNKQTIQRNIELEQNEDMDIVLELMTDEDIADLEHKRIERINNARD